MATPGSENGRLAAASPRPKFDADALKLYIKAVLQTTLATATWPDGKDYPRVKAWCKEISSRVKERMIKLQPQGFKYVVITQVNENMNQGGSADIACHWEDCDAIAQELFYNDSLICICVALAIRIV